MGKLLFKNSYLSILRPNNSADVRNYTKVDQNSFILQSSVLPFLVFEVIVVMMMSLLSGLFTMLIT